MKKRKSDMDQFTPKSRVESFLKKPMKKKDPKSMAFTEEEKQEFLRKVYTQEPKFTSKKNILSLMDRIKRNYYWRKRVFRTKRFKKFSYESLPLILFCTVSCYVTYLMQYEVDEMQRKIKVVKSMRQEEVERENELLSGALSGERRYVQKPIREPEPINVYKLDDDAYEGDLMKVPIERSDYDDLNADEMKTLMEQFNKKSEEMGEAIGPNPGYSLSALENQRRIEKFKEVRDKKMREARGDI